MARLALRVNGGTREIESDVLRGDLSHARVIRAVLRAAAATPGGR